jgi:hypothetical protein
MANPPNSPRPIYTSFSRELVFYWAASLIVLIAGVILVFLSAGLTSQFLGTDNSQTFAMLTLGISAIFAGLTMIVSILFALRTAVNPSALPTPHKIGASREALGSSRSTEDLPKAPIIEVQAILISEFEYARETASQSMEERRTVINYYLLVFGGAGTGVIAVLSGFGTNNEFLVGATALLWLVCLIGWLTLFNLIALRLAWNNSALSMNYIKEFYVDNAEEVGMKKEDLESAFFFRANTLPAPNKRWNTFHYSTLLVSLLDSAAFVGGATLLGALLAKDQLGYVSLSSVILGSALFMAHWWAFDVSLKPKRPRRRKPSIESKLKARAESLIGA